MALGRTLLASPRPLPLDERLAARDELRLPMLYVSHAINKIPYPTPHLAVMEQGRILGPRRIADRILVEVDVGAPILAEITVKAVHDLGLMEGDTAYRLFKARAWQYVGTR